MYFDARVDDARLTLALARTASFYGAAVLSAVPGTLAGSAHQSHAYPDSGCLYFSLCGEVEVDKRAQWYRAAWDAANAVILKYGATLMDSAEQDVLA